MADPPVEPYPWSVTTSSVRRQALVTKPPWRDSLGALRQYYVPVIFIGLCYLAITMMWTLYSALVPIFLVRDYGMQAVAVGFVMMLDNVAALFIQPWIGARSDRLRTRLGGRLPIILLTAPGAGLSFMLIPTAGELLGGLTGFVAVLSLMLISMAAIRVPLFALMPDLVPPERRSTANGILNLFGGLGTLIAALGLGSLYRMNRASPFWLAGALLIFFVLLLVLVLRRLAGEQLRGGTGFDDPSKTEDRSSWQMMREVLAGSWRGVPLLLLGVLVYTFGFNAIETFFSLYGLTQLALSEDQALVLLGLFFLAYLLASVPAGMIGERAGRRKTMIWGLVFLGTMLGVAFLVHSVPFLVVLMPLGGMAWALVNSNALPAVVNTAIPQHAGSAVGLYYSATTLASILSPPVNGWLVQLAGGNYGTILLTAGVASALGAGCLLVTRRLAVTEPAGVA